MLIKFPNFVGSEIEDRQYELTIGGISLSTSTWDEFDPILNLKSSNVSHLKTMSENPALAWNLGKGQLGKPHSAVLNRIINRYFISLTSKFIINSQFFSRLLRFDLLIVTAPAMIHKNEVICGHSVEINFVSNIDFQISLNQIILVTVLRDELNAVLDLIMNDVRISKRPQLNLSFVTVGMHKAAREESVLVNVVDLGRDSGFETSSVSLKTKVFFLLTKCFVINDDCSGRKVPAFARCQRATNLRISIQNQLRVFH